jgi:hypothetical protein
LMNAPQVSGCNFWMVCNFTASVMRSPFPG